MAPTTHSPPRTARVVERRDTSPLTDLPSEPSSPSTRLDPDWEPAAANSEHENRSPPPPARPRRAVRARKARSKQTAEKNKKAKDDKTKSNKAKGKGRAGKSAPTQLPTPPDSHLSSPTSDADNVNVGSSGSDDADDTALFTPLWSNPLVDAMHTALETSVANPEPKNDDIVEPPCQIEWKDNAWNAVSGGVRRAFGALQREWYAISPSLWLSSRLNLPSFRSLISSARVIDFRSVFPFELGVQRSAGVQVPIGPLPYFRIWTVPHHRKDADATAVVGDAETVVLLNNAPPAPEIAPAYTSFLKRATMYHELAVVPRPATTRSFPRIVLHLGNNMAPKAAYDFVSGTKELVLVVDDLETMDPTFLASLLALALAPTPAPCWDEKASNGDKDMFGHMHITLVGDCSLSKQQARAFGADSQVSLAGFVRYAGEAVYGAKGLAARCDIVSHEEYKTRIGDEAYGIEMGTDM